MVNGQWSVVNGELDTFPFSIEFTIDHSPLTIHHSAFPWSVPIGPRVAVRLHQI
jgi:hypothetical protein